MKARLSFIACLVLAIVCLLFVDEVSAKAAPVTTTTWREIEPSKWSASQALEWLRSVLYSSDSPLDPHRRHVVLEDFEKHQITGSQLMDWLRHGMNTDSDIFKTRVKVEEVGVRTHIMQQLRDFMDKLHLSSHIGRDRDVHLESDKHHTTDKYFERESTRRHHDRDVHHDRDIHHEKTAGLFGFLLSMKPIAWVWHTFRWILSPIITLFQLGGLWFVYSALMSRRENQSTLLDRSSVLFRQLLNGFYSIFETRVDTIRGKNGSSSMLMQALKFLVGGPLSIVGGPFAYLMCMFRVLSRTLLDNIPALLPGIAGLTAAYFLLPERLWAPVSFVLFNVIGSYGVVRFLMQTYRLISSTLFSHTAAIPQKQAGIQQQSVQQPIKTTTAGVYSGTPIPASTISTTEQVPSTESTSAGSVPVGTISSTSSVGNVSSIPSSTSSYSDTTSSGYNPAGSKYVEGRHDIYAPTMATKRHTGAAS